MCGIVGIIGNLTYQEEAKFKQMLIVDQLRGFDSVGAFAVKGSMAVEYNKTTADPALFLGMPDTKKLFAGINKVMIGHNRAATYGGVCDANAHPFVDGPIIGVHNGSITDHKQLADTEVDSMAILQSMHTRGVTSTYKLIQRPGAMVWWDSRTKRLNVLRSSDRPLHYAIHNGVMFLMSEELMLDFVLKRADRFGKEIVADIFEFKTNTLHQIDPNNLSENGVLKCEEIALTPCQQTYTRPAITYYQKAFTQPYEKEVDKQVSCLFLDKQRVGKESDRYRFQPLDDDKKMKRDSRLLVYSSEKSKPFWDWVVKTQASKKTRDKTVFKFTIGSSYDTLEGNRITKIFIASSIRSETEGRASSILYKDFLLEVESPTTTCQFCGKEVKENETVFVNDSQVCKDCEKWLSDDPYVNYNRYC